MAARKRLYHPEEVRQKIRASQLVNVLEKHIFKGTPMTKTQVAAALGLLKKTIPDLSSVDTTLRGDKDAPIALNLSGSDVDG